MARLGSKYGVMNGSGFRYMCVFEVKQCLFYWHRPNKVCVCVQDVATPLLCKNTMLLLCLLCSFSLFPLLSLSLSLSLFHLLQQ